MGFGSHHCSSGYMFESGYDWRHKNETPSPPPSPKIYSLKELIKKLDDEENRKRIFIVSNEEKENTQLIDDQENSIKKIIYEKKLDYIHTMLNNLEYDKTPIKYLKNIYPWLKDMQNFLNRNKRLSKILKIEKINNRYYCCKNRIDKFIELKQQKHIWINY